MNKTIIQENLPKHIAITMDGNGRWAKEKGKNRIFGHNQGIEAVRDTVEGAVEYGIKFLTLFAFSTENWNRPKHEVNALMKLLISSIHNETKTLLKNNIKLTSEIKINLNDNHIDITENNTTTITRIIKESFPDFNSVIPDKKENKATVESLNLIEAIKRVSIFSNKTTRQITLSFEHNELVISTEDKETKSSAKEHVPCVFEGN